MYFINYYGKLTMNGSSPFLPGVEVYNACKSAEEKSVPIHFMEGMFNSQTLKNWEHEKRSYLIPFMFNFLKGTGTVQSVELSDLRKMINVRGLENLSESLDDKHMAHFIYNFEKLSPHHKSIFIDNENERLFRQIYRKMEGDTLVAVVNQWHVPAIEAFWKHSTQTETLKEFINPVGDMDINAINKSDSINSIQRRLFAKNSKSEPNVTLNYISHYHKMIVEAERSRHVLYENTQDGHLEHGLYNDENKDVHYKKHSEDHH